MLLLWCSHSRPGANLVLRAWRAVWFRSSSTTSTAAAWSSAMPGLFQTHRDWHNLLPFHEYFHGDTGRGAGAGHQTGWTALVAGLVLRTADHGATGNRHDWLQGTRRVLYGITAETSSCRTSTGACRASSARRRCRPPAASLNNHELRHRAPRTLTKHGNPNTAT